MTAPRILSLGAGVQSTALATCGCDCEQFGRCPDPWHGGTE